MPKSRDTRKWPDDGGERMVEWPKPVVVWPKVEPTDLRGPIVDRAARPKRAPDWPAFVASAALVLIAAVCVLLFVLPALLNRLLP